MKLDESTTTLLPIVAVSILATAMAILRLATWLESASFITGGLGI